MQALAACRIVANNRWIQTPKSVFVHSSREKLLAWRQVVIVSIAAAAVYWGYKGLRESERLRVELAQTRMELADVQDSEKQAPTNPLPVAPASPLFRSKALPGSVTDEDLREALAMNERQKKGEYILKFERSADRKLMEAGVKELASRTASNREPALSAVFSQLRISPDVAKQLETHQEKITLASVLVETAMQQALLARQTYDTRVRGLLSPEDYGKYRQFEDSTLATSEYSALQQFAAQKNTPLDSAYEQQIVGLIHDSQAYTGQTWVGPYDGWPQITVGSDMLAQKIEQEIGQIGQAASDLRQKATQANLPAPYVDLLTSYFGDRIRARVNMLDQLKNPAPGG